MGLCRFLGKSVPIGLPTHPCRTKSSGTLAFRLWHALEFEWDPRKAAGNLAKHKVSFEEAATVFGDPLGRIVADPRHSAVEERLVLLGISKQRRLLAVMYIERAETVRIISARLATRPERRDYEEIPQ